MKVCIDSNLCNGSGVCIEVCPEVFELNDQGATVAKCDQVPSECAQACMEASQKCPTGAIKVEE
jgi:ferredoxin